jgi:hypothetical protein
VYVIDSYPIAFCDNYRICRSKIYHGEDWRGYIASKKRYFYGVRIHIMVIEDLLREAGIELLPLRKKNSLRSVPA